MAESMSFLNKFPSISRRITENKSLQNLRKKWIKLLNQYKLNKIYAYFSIFLTLLISLVLIISLFFVIFDFSQNFTKYQELNLKRQEISSKINFWKSIANKYSGYPDAYFNIAVLYFELNDLRNSRAYLNRTLMLNPGYKNALELDKSLKEKGY